MIDKTQKKISLENHFLASSIVGEHLFIRKENQRPGARRSVMVFPELSLAFFPFFVEMAVLSVLPIVCYHRYQIDIHESSKRATPRERNEMALVNHTP